MPLVRGLALLLAALALSGCITMAVESDFNEDGSATHSFTVTVDTSQLGDLGEGLDPSEGFEDIEDEALEEGYRVENISEGDLLGVRIIRDVEDTEDLGQILNELFNAGSDEGQEINPFSGTFEKDGDDFRLELTVDGDALSQGAGEGLGEGGAGDMEGLGFVLDQIFEMSYTARLPGEIDEDETNGEIGADGAVTWDLPVSGQETLTARSSDGGDSNLLLILVIVGALFLGLIALAVIGFIIYMGRRTPAPGEPSAAAPAAGPPAAEEDWWTGPDQPTRPMPPPASDEPRPGEPAR